MECVICKKPAVPNSTYCPRCRKFIHVPRERAARARALKAAWRERLDAFACHYSGAVLEERDTRSPYYLTFDHPVPGTKGRLVACAALFNSMKTDLEEGEFRAVVSALARTFETGADFPRDAVKLEHWVRMARLRTRSRKEASRSQSRSGKKPARSRTEPGRSR